MKMMLAAVVLLGALPGIGCSVAEAPSQGADDGVIESRLSRVERRVDEAEDVIVEQVLALRRRVETLEARVQVLEAELKALRGSSPPSDKNSLLPRPKPSAPLSPPQRLK
jgi:hypothetical protein